VTVATVAVFASVGALYHDQALNKWSDKYPYALFAWFLLGYFFLFFTAARVTDATRFYEILAEALSMERAQICPPDPSHSAIVMRVASIGRRILLFWLGIAFSVLTMLIFLPPFPHFAGAVVAIASFFSIGLGTIVFLRSEMHIASAVYDVIISTLRDTEAEIMRLGGSLASLTSDGSERLKELVEFHKELSTTGGYRNVVLTSMSILAPLLGPVMTFLLSKGFAPLAALVRWNIFSSH
jgi:hypothetical protein